MSTQKETVEEVKTGVEQAANAGTPKKRRRGISNDTRSTSRLKFSHKDVRVNGVFLGHLKVYMKWVTFGEDAKGSPSFIGKAVPQLVIEFSSTHTKKSDKRYNTHTIFARESNADNIPGGAKYRFIENDFQMIKHVLDVIVLKGRELTEAEEDALELGYEDFDENGAYEPVETDEVIKAWAVLFENIVNMIETGGKDGKSALLNEKGEPRLFWAKMYRYYKQNGEWVPAAYGSSVEGDLVFPTYVKEGIFEEAFLDANKQVIPSKRVKLDEIRESIIPMENVTRKKPNMAGAPSISNIPVGGGIIPGAPMMPGAPMAAPSAPSQFDGVFNGDANGDDLPF